MSSENILPEVIALRIHLTHSFRVQPFLLNSSRLLSFYYPCQERVGTSWAICCSCAAMAAHTGRKVARKRVVEVESDDREMESASERKRESTRGAPLMVDVSVCRSDGRQARISNN